MPEPSLSLRRDVLHAWLQVSGYNQAELARALKVSEGRISQILHSKNEGPSPRLMAALLRITSLPFDRLFSLRPEGKLLEKRMRQLTRFRRGHRRGASRGQRTSPKVR
jgi:transcriptional regulator with XRE-family HTH domain